MGPSTVEQSPLYPSTAQHCLVQLSRAQYIPVEQSLFQLGTSLNWCHLINFWCHLINFWCHDLNWCQLINIWCHFINFWCHFINFWGHVLNWCQLINIWGHVLLIPSKLLAAGIVKLKEITLTYTCLTLY